MGPDVAVKHSFPGQVRQGRNYVGGAGDEYPLAAAKRKRFHLQCLKEVDIFACGEASRSSIYGFASS